MNGIRAVVLVVLDSVGIGGAPDAAAYGDAGSATLPHIAESVGGLSLPNLAGLGLGRIADIKGVAPVDQPTGAFGSLTERSAGKDTTTGHWELAGVVLERPFPVYPEGFPPEVIERFEASIGTGTLGNCAASGTAIIEALGEEHLETGKPIVYTSADSVFQIAAHVDVVPLERLYEMCRIAREILTGPHEVGRVIARPFTGAPGRFERTPDRHDFSVLPPRNTVLDDISAAGMEVRGVGKISDIFGGRGLTSSRPTKSNDDGITAVVEEVGSISRGLVFANLVDFDSAFGHRNDPAGYAGALEALDSRVPELRGNLRDDDVLIITADHGNDPTTPSTDHSRERVPVLCAGDLVAAGTDVGHRSSFTDCAATIADLLGVESSTPGASFASDLVRSVANPAR
jgi:phosphopentomutase